MAKSRFGCTATEKPTLQQDSRGARKSVNNLILAGVSPLPFVDIHPPKTHYFASRWGFTIAIWPLPFGYIYTLIWIFCFSLGFYHCHLTMAIRMHTPSYAPITTHWPILVLLAGVSPLPFYHGLLYRYSFISTHTRSRVHPLPSTDPLFCFSLGFYHCHLETRFAGPWPGQPRCQPSLWKCIYTKGNFKMAMVKPQRKAKEWVSGW